MLSKIHFKALLFLGLILLSSCSKAPGGNQEEEARELELLRMEIFELAHSAPCVDASQWDYAPFGSKPCGGPRGYVAYAGSIDTTRLFNLLEAHRELERAYNLKWGIGSDCSVPEEPKGVACVDGKGELLY